MTSEEIRIEQLDLNLFLGREAATKKVSGSGFLPMHAQPSVRVFGRIGKENCWLLYMYGQL